MTPNRAVTTNSSWAALRNPDFRKLWIATVLSGTCVAAHDNAVTWMMNTLSESPFLISFMSTVASLPLFPGFRGAPRSRRMRSPHFFTPLLILPTSSRNDSGIPDTAKKPATKKTPAARKPAGKAPTPIATASAVTKAMLAKVERAYKKADMPNFAALLQPAPPGSRSSRGGRRK
jgi:Transmembrane secretion effector